MEKKTISFIIPHLGDSEIRKKGLQDCLDSIKMLDYPQELIEIVVIEGPETVPEKVKKGVEQTTGEWIVYAANDCVFTPNSIEEALITNKRLVAFNTGALYLDGGNVCEHFMIRRDLIKELDGKEIFCTEFHHCGVDNYLWAQCEKLGEAVRNIFAIVKHNHFTKGAEFDDVYKKGWEKVAEDRELLRKKLDKLYAAKS